MIKLKYFFLFIFFSIFFGCQNINKINGPELTGERGYLISSERIAQLPRSTPSLLALLFSITLNRDFDVDVYKIIYETIDWKGMSQRASGLLYLPVGSSLNNFPILSIQHLTITEEEQIPSKNHFGQEGQVAFIAASSGFIVCVSDYLGYGESAQIFHPYLHTNSADAPIDMIRATMTYCAQNNISLNSQIFLTGYSEGGYITMATHRAMETQFADEFTVTASVPIAGAYDVLLTAETILSKNTYQTPSLIAFITESYRSIYGREELNNIFQSPYKSIITSLFNGSLSLSEIDSQLSSSLNTLLTAEFLSAFRGDGQQDLKDNLKENNLLSSSWIPQAPIRLYHGNNDNTVPYTNSIIMWSSGT